MSNILKKNNNDNEDKKEEIKKLIVWLVILAMVISLSLFVHLFNKKDDNIVSENNQTKEQIDYITEEDQNEIEAEIDNWLIQNNKK